MEWDDKIFREQVLRDVKKLIDQYVKHGSLIVAVDFDDTVYPFSEELSDLEYVREVVRKAKSQGHKLLLLTCRDKYEGQVKRFLTAHGIEVDYFNEVTVSGEGWGGEGSKPFYSWFLDDKASLYMSTYILDRALDEIQKLVDNSDKLV